MASWWYLAAGQPTGPVSDEQLRALALSGALSPTSPVFRDGGADWCDLSDHEAELGLPRNTWGTYFAAPPRATQEFERGGVETQRAGAWARYKASFLDNTLLGVFSFVLMLLAGPLAGRLGPVSFMVALWVAYGVLLMLYEVLSTAVRGQTPGKLAAHIEVAVVGTMEVPDIWRSLLRSLVKAITGIIFPLWWISLLMILVTKRRTGLHDLVAGTVVQEARY
ncbi:MAG: RDD family protein [Acidimicrobiia bacterium]